MGKEQRPQFRRAVCTILASLAWIVESGALEATAKPAEWAQRQEQGPGQGHWQREDDLYLPFLRFGQPGCGFGARDSNFGSRQSRWWFAEGDKPSKKAGVPAQKAGDYSPRKGEAVANMAGGLETVLCAREHEIPERYDKIGTGHRADHGGAQQGQGMPEKCCHSRKRRHAARSFRCTCRGRLCRVDGRCPGECRRGSQCRPGQTGSASACHGSCGWQPDTAHLGWTCAQDPCQEDTGAGHDTRWGRHSADQQLSGEGSGRHVHCVSWCASRASPSLAEKLGKTGYAVIKCRGGYQNSCCINGDQCPQRAGGAQQAQYSSPSTRPLVGRRQRCRLDGTARDCRRASWWGLTGLIDGGGAWQRGGGVWIHRHVPSEPERPYQSWRRGGSVSGPTEPEIRNDGKGDNHGLRTDMMGRMDSTQVFFQVLAFQVGITFESGGHGSGIFSQCPAWQRGGDVWIRRRVPSEPQHCGLTRRRGGGVWRHRHVPTEPVFGSNDVLSPCLNGGRLILSAILFTIGVLQCGKCESMSDVAMIGVCDVKACKMGGPFPLPESQPIHGVGYVLQAVGFCGCRLGAFYNFFPAQCQRGLIWDATLGRSAEALRFSMMLLQRQHLLPVAFGFANGLARRICPSDRHTPNETLCSPHLFSLSYVSGCQRKKRSWLCDMIRRFPFYLTLLTSHFHLWIWLFANALGSWWQQAFAFLVLAGGVHMCQLILFAIQLKGGQCNVDNLLRCFKEGLWWLPTGYSLCAHEVFSETFFSAATATDWFLRRPLALLDIHQCFMQWCRSWRRKSTQC